MKFINYTIILVMILSSIALSQTGWTYYKYKDLPVPSMSFCIQSDYNGGIFLGGSGGLMKYNGFEWIKIYYNELDPMAQDNKFNIRKVIPLGGEVWAGTNEGLIKFDGYDRKHYNLTNSPSMFDDKIRGITRDKYGNIWFVNHALGIFELERTTDSVVYYSIPQSTPLPFSEDIPMFCDGYDNIWYSCQGKFVKFSDSIVKVIDSTEIPELKNDLVSSIQIMSDNSIMVLMKHSLVQYSDKNGNISFTKFNIPSGLMNDDEYFFMIKVDLEGNCWILSRLTYGQGIGSQYFYKFSKNKEWTKYEFPIFEGTTQNIYAFSDFTVDEKGKVWFADPYYGVFVFDSKATSVEEFINKEEISISPNPASDYIDVDLGNYTLKYVVETGKIEIFDIFGKFVMTIETQNFVSRQKIVISALPTGMYFLGFGEKVSKFIKI